MESVIGHSYDDSLKLQAIGSAAITATTTSTLVDIQRITASARGALNNRYGEGSFDVVAHITALDHTTGDETYTISFNTYDAAGANPVTHETVTWTIADLGLSKVYKFDTKTIQGLDIDAAKFGIVVTVAGTTPILQYWAFVAPNKRFG